MVTINASEFKAKCLAILDRVADTGEPVVILKRGRPVAQLVPPISSESRYPQKELLESVRITGDVVEPVLPAEAWEAVVGKADE
jgi:prevent-host-death family protein